MTHIIEDVVYQHAENACALWRQRQYAVDEPHYSYLDLVNLDDRLEANLDGLRIAGEAGDPILATMAEADDEGAYFVQTLLAVERGNQQAFWSFVEMAESSSTVQDELKSALAWISPQYLKDIVMRLLNSPSANALALGLSTCAAHGRHPGRVLSASASHGKRMVRVAACRTAINLGDQDFVSAIITADSDDEWEHFARVQAKALLGQRDSAITSLKTLAVSTSDYASNAVSLLMLMSDSATGRSVLKELDGMNGRARDVVRGFGLLGDPVAMNWLIDRTTDAELARLAGGSITMITGVDIAYDDLELDHVVTGSSYGPNDDPADNNVSMDEDENLPWPDTNRLIDWWKSCAGFTNGTRYLNGREKRSKELHRVLKRGLQLQRHVASLSLALTKPDMPLYDTRLPLNKQMRWM